MADEDVYEQLLNLIQQACQAGQLKKDATESTMSVNNGIAELVIVANDAPLVVILRHLRILCRYKKVHCVSVACRLALGRACGVDDPVSACSIIKDGDEAGEDVVNKQVKILVEKLLRYQEKTRLSWIPEGWFLNHRMVSISSCEESELEDTFVDVEAQTSRNGEDNEWNEEDEWREECERYEQDEWHHQDDCYEEFVPSEQSSSMVHTWLDLEDLIFMEEVAPFVLSFIVVPFLVLTGWEIHNHLLGGDGPSIGQFVVCWFASHVLLIGSLLLWARFQGWV